MRFTDLIFDHNLWGGVEREGRGAHIDWPGVMVGEIKIITVIPFHPQ